MYVLHFAAVPPNAGREIEYKGEKDKIDFICDSSTLKPINGRIKVPTGPGFGLELTAAYLKNSEIVG